MARALAFIGMVFVNFKMVLGSEGNELLAYGLSFLEGKAAAVFVVLAGIGLAFMSKSAIQSENFEKIKKVKVRIVKRAIFLFGIGLSYVTFWSADILHFYGIYMLITLPLLTSKNKTILSFAALLIFIYPVLMLLIDYDLGWNFFSFEYTGFWTWRGFFRNLLFNGFHPGIPWAAFMLVGLWFGRKDLTDHAFIRKALLISLFTFISLQVMSFAIIDLLSSGNDELKVELLIILGMSPMPPLPFYMLAGCSFAIFSISACILIADRFKDTLLVKTLGKTGQLALTFYVAHVLLGIGIIENINPAKMGKYSAEFSLLYAVAFCGICVVFAVCWRKYKSIGPLEWCMRKIAD